MKKFYAFLYIYDTIIAAIISLIISILITAALIMIVLFSNINYSDLAGYIISVGITLIFLSSLIFIWFYLADKISDYSYLKIYQDDKFYRKAWLKKAKI